ncbi:DMT family transporter [Paracoccus pacificus]|uniref:DMT family transporter n=1 Tax=Paracoccus pacificus TaxID=1463598 RepID=A0ABW4RBP8_9RHOB
MDRNPTGKAAALILGYALIIGFVDCGVRFIAREISLWQFHLLRGLIALPLMIAAARALGFRLWPRNLRPVVARSLVQGFAMLLYFGSLGFLPLPQVVAGLFTAPIFVLLIVRLVYGDPIGPVRIIAVGLGFVGILLALRPFQNGGISMLMMVPVAAGFFYGLANIATRRWCEGETAETLTFGFFTALALSGVIGTLYLLIWPATPAGGPAAFLQHPAAMPSPTVWAWVIAQAIGSVVGVTMMMRAYQLIETSRAAGA